MARGKQFDQKMKPYLVYQYLMRCSDDNNVVSASDIVGYLQEVGISAERRSVYRDIEEINKAILIAESPEEDKIDIEEASALIGEDDSLKTIIYDKSRKGFYVRARNYDLPDIRMLIECVYSSKFIDKKRSERLVNVVCDLVSEQQAEDIKHDVFLTDRQKTENTAIFDIIQTIDKAIHTKEKIKFKYLKCTIQNLNGQVERRGGADYIVSPYKLLINDGNYYLLAFENGIMKHFRVDRMKNAKQIKEKREGEKEFGNVKLENYTKRHFGMFGGTKEHIKLQVASHLLDTMVDRFGKSDGANYGKIDENHFSLYTEIEISPQFYGWLCGFGSDIKILSPEWVIKDFTDYLDKMRELYK